MSSEAMLQRAQELFDNCQYSEAGNLAIEVLKADPTSARPAYLMFARSYLHLLTPFNLEDNQDTFFSAIGSAIDTADSIEEAFEIDYEVMSYIETWRGIQIAMAIGTLQGNPCFDEWKKYIPINVNILNLKMLAQVTMRNRSKLKAMYDEQGITVAEAVEKYAKNADMDVLDEIQYSMLFDAACKIFEEARTYLRNNNNGNGDYIQRVVGIALERVMVAHLMVDYATPKQEDTHAVETRILRLKSRAAMLDFMMKEMVYPNGQAMSFYQGNRTDYINDMVQYYAEIKEYEPDFVAPELPSSTHISPPAKSGGCYVATAVYGSYDCPEVWTLRRFRDFSLAESWYGRAFIRAYYAVSPTLVKWFGQTEWFKKLWKGHLDRMVNSLRAKGVEDTPYEDRIW